MTPALPAVEPVASRPPVEIGSLWQRLVRGRTAIACEADWERFAGPDWASTIMTVPVSDRHHAKQGRSIGRWTLTDSDARLVVYLKRHFELPRSRGLLAVLFPGRAWSPGGEEQVNLEWARLNGFAVPRTVAAGELLGPWGRLQSFLAVEELTGMLALHEAVPLAQSRLSSDEFTAWKQGLTSELARLCRELHRRRAFHQDLYLCHFYIAESDCTAVPADWRDRVWMIDFHRLTHRRLGWQWWLAKDLGQLLYSTYDVPGIEDPDRERFWEQYRTGNWGDVSPPPRWIDSAARWRAGRYWRHNQRRTAR